MSVPADFILSQDSIADGLVACGASIVDRSHCPLKRGFAPSEDAPLPKRRKMSAEGRTRIAAAQKARWAKFGMRKPSPGKELLANQE